MQSINGKNIWIIGASTGIGYALAKELSLQGAHLMLSARNTDKLELLNKELGNKHHIHPIDISDINSVDAAVTNVKEKKIHIDSIINLAAIYEPHRLDQLDIEQTRQMLDINLMGTLNLIHACLPILKSQKRGQFALCGSVAGFRGLANGQPYSATKAAVINIAESLKLENPELDIKIINPGFVRTPLTDKNKFNMPMMIAPEQAALELSKALQKNNFEIHFPKKFTRIMKLLRILPHALYFKIAQHFSTNR